MKKDYSKLWVLFKSMFALSACTFGGGFVIVSLMKKRYVEELKWLEDCNYTIRSRSFAGKCICHNRISDCRHYRFFDSDFRNHPSAYDHHFCYFFIL